MKPRPSLEKRRKELQRQERNRDKEERRKTRREERLKEPDAAGDTSVEPTANVDGPVKSLSGSAGSGKTESSAEALQPSGAQSGNSAP